MFIEDDGVLEEIKMYLTPMTDIPWFVDATPTRRVLKSSPISNAEHKNHVAALLYDRLGFATDKEKAYDCCHLAEQNGISMTWYFVLYDSVTQKTKDRIQLAYDQMISDRQNEISCAEEHKRYLSELTGVKWMVNVPQNKLLQKVFLSIDQEILGSYYKLLMTSFHLWSQKHGGLKWKIKLRKFFERERYVVNVMDDQKFLPEYYFYMKENMARQRARVERIANRLCDRVRGGHFQASNVNCLLDSVYLIAESQEHSSIVSLLQEGGWIDRDTHTDSTGDHWIELPLVSINLAKLFSDELSEVTESGIIARLNEQRRMIVELKQQVDERAIEQDSAGSQLNEIAIQLSVAQEKIIDMQMSAATFANEEDLGSLEEQVLYLKEQFDALSTAALAI